MEKDEEAVPPNVKMEIEDNVLNTYIIDIKEEPPLEIESYEYLSESISISESESSSKSILETHIKYECTKCDMFFKTQHEIKEHSQKVHPESIEYVEEILTKTGKPVYGRCLSCNYLSDKKDNLLRHFKVRHYGQDLNLEYKCKNCDGFFKTPEALTEHTRFAHPGKYINTKYAFGRCNICNYMSDRTFNLQTHFERRHPQQELNIDYKCWKCNTFFNNIKDLCNHTATGHSIEKKVKKTKVTKLQKLTEPVMGRCQVCNYTSGSKEDLLTHFKSQHPDQDPNVQYKCKYCDELFKTIKDVSNHSQNAHPEYLEIIKDVFNRKKVKQKVYKTSISKLRSEGPTCSASIHTK
ncbi:ZKSCAN7 family protein [Megaselia abdita]